MFNRLCLSALTTATVALLGACTSPNPMPNPMPAPLTQMPRFSQANLPDAVKVPGGHSVTMETAAAGDITYQCRAKKDMADQFEWVFAGPSAGLKDRKGATVGKYFGPPATWESNDGSKITGTQVAVAPNGEGNIPAQLVKANPAVGTGVMQGVSYIQRVATQGGVAPKAACAKANEGEKRVVTYTADYIFYRVM